MANTRTKAGALAARSDVGETVPFDYQQSFQLLTLLRRVAAEADGTGQEPGHYAISCDLLNSINDLLIAIDERRQGG